MPTPRIRAHPIRRRQICKIGALLVDVVPLFISALVAAQAMGQGAVIRVFISEIFPIAIVRM